MIVIINYKMGNLGSIFNMLKKVGAKAIISSDFQNIESAEKLVLPGVGAFDSGMKNLKDMGLIPILEEAVLNKKKPILGICLGMQLFSKTSEEGILSGLGWIDAKTEKFKFEGVNNNLKIPHMGWNTVTIKRQSCLTREMGGDERFYFLHSYHVICNKDDDILAITNYGYDFASMIHHENIFGVQFHPEKSHKFGMKILKNFAENC